MPPVPAFVYILPHPVAPRFKIGKANHIPSRVRQIGVDQFDFSRSSALRVGTETDAYNLERMLHKMFGRYRVPEEDIIAFEGGRPDGASEWFDTSCEPRLTQFLSENADLLGFFRLEATEVQSLVKPAKAALLAEQRLASAQRAASRNSDEKFQKSQKKREATLARTLRAREHQAEDIQAACALADAEFLPAIRTLSAYCWPLLLQPSEDAGSASLVGQCDTNQPAELQRAFAALRKLSFVGEGNRMNLTTHFSSCETPQGVSFHIRIVWPAGRSVTPLIDATRSRMASYPLDIPGWRKPLSNAEKKAVANILATLKDRSA